MDEKQRQQFIDACRPGSADLELPELAPLRELLESDDETRRRWEAAQAWERRIQDACHDVDVPAGLQQRLLARLKDQASVADEPPPLEVAADQADVANRRPRRRWWLVGATLAALLFVALAGIHQLWFATIPAKRVATQASQWARTLAEQDGWRVDWSADPRDAYPVSGHLEAGAFAWQKLAVEYDPEATVYRLLPLEYPDAPLLFVLRSRLRVTPNAWRPPLQPDLDTGGITCGVWREDDWVYALVVPGQVHDYQRQIRELHARLNRPGRLAGQGS